MKATPIQMINDLMSIKLPEIKRSELRAAKHILESEGRLPLSVVNEVRKLYKRHSRGIAALHEAREKGRISMARQAMSLSNDNVAERRAKRLKALKDKGSVLGF